MRKLRKSALSAALVLCMVFATSAASCEQYQDVAPYALATQDESPPSTTDQVNNLPYSINDPGPAMQAFRIVAADRGWTQDNIEAWAPFVQATMKTESQFCPSVIYGQHADSDCDVRGRPKGSAAGFGQVLMRVHGKWMCGQEGLCDRWAVVATPYDSMTALVALIERSGAGPWCYRGSHHRTGSCRLVP